MSLETICCGCNIFTMAKIITGIEMGMMMGFNIILGFYGAISGKFIICLAYLAIEFIGIHKKIQGLIKLNCSIRFFVSILNGILIMIIATCMLGGYGCTMRRWKESIGTLIFFVTTMIYLIFRTWLQFKVFYANRASNTTLSNIAEIQPL